jgi:hypothetical protein
MQKLTPKLTASILLSVTKSTEDQEDKNRQIDRE